MEDAGEGRSERNEWQSQPQNWKLKRKDNEGRKGGTTTKRNGNPGIADGSLNPAILYR